MRHPCEEMWGTRGGQTSSDSAFSHNLEQEVGDLLEEHTATILLDMSKCFEMVRHDSLIIEARELGYPLRLLWMLLQLYCQPRRIRAYGSWSRPYLAKQGIIAGCTHATYLLYLLLYRTLKRASTLCPSVTPRALVDDVGLQLVSTEPTDLLRLGMVATSFASWALERGLVLNTGKSALVVGSVRTRQALDRLLKRKPRGVLWTRSTDACHVGRFPRAAHMRNLGHELHGPKVRRTVAKKRLDQLRARRHRFGILQRAVGRRTTTLWRTGAMPAVAHGAGVSGVTDEALRELRRFAAVLNGAPGASNVGVTSYLLTHRAEHYDPIYGATLDVVLRYAGWIWDGRTSLSRLWRAWTAFNQHHGNPRWDQVRGPLGVTLLTLRRIGWDMASPQALRDDVGRHYDLLQTCPADLKIFLVEGIQRWQHARLQRHWYTDVGAPIWHRGLRYAVKGIRHPRRLGALQAHWADNIPIPIRRDMKFRQPMRPCQACGAVLDQHTCWGHVFLDCPGLLEDERVQPTGAGASAAPEDTGPEHQEDPIGARDGDEGDLLPHPSPDGAPEAPREVQRSSDDIPATPQPAGDRSRLTDGIEVNAVVMEEADDFFPGVGEVPEDAPEEEPPAEPSPDDLRDELTESTAMATNTQCVGATQRAKDHAFLAIPPHLLEVRDQLRAAGLGGYPELRPNLLSVWGS